MTANKQDLAEPLSKRRLEEVLWVVEARAGSAEAFQQLLTQFERPVLYYLRRLIGDAEAVLDAHQEVWLEAFRRIGQLEQPESFRAWLFRIARGKAARFVRREIRKDDLLEAWGNELDSENDQEGPWDAEAVHRALDRLPIAQREALTLHYLQDLSLEEIATVLECPLGTIKSRLHHGRMAMRALLAKEQLLWKT